MFTNAHKPQLIIIFIVSFIAINAFSQEAEKPDSTQVQDSVSITIKNKKDQLESPIYYWHNSGGISRSENKIYLRGNAKLVYQNMTLEAERITIDRQNNTLFAEGVTDTSDSFGNPVYRGSPVFTEKGREPIYGSALFYNFKTKRGKIQVGKTQMPPGYYKGNRIHKISEKTLLVRDGYFTSCEYIDEPHFYFKSADMRISVNDKIVARPVYFYIADVPLFVIPFGVFPNKKGRRSGIIVPNYGESGYGGRFLKNLGYYWAPNDYFDATFQTDYYDRLGFMFKSDMQYTVRYLLNGSVSGFYFPRDPNTGQKRERWSVGINHSQTIDPTLRIAAYGKFQSDKNLEQELSSNFFKRTNQLITSNLTVTKSFPGTKNSLSANISRTENLQNGNISYTFPNIRFSRSQSNLYETITGKTIRGQTSWFQDINFSYNSNLLRKGSKTLQQSGADSGSFLRQEDQGAEHRISLNSPQKILNYFNITPSISYQEIWVDKITVGSVDAETNKIVKTQKEQFAIRRTFNGSVALKTTLYGLFEPNIGSLKFIRHKIDPQISYTFTPDFSDPFYGYYTPLPDTNVKIDKFERNPFGATSNRESQFLRISVANLFQAKLIEGDQEKKIDLFTLNFNTGYDFKRDSLQWQNLTTSLRSTPLKGISITVSTTHSLYAAATNGVSPVNKFLLSEGRLPRLLNLRASTSFSLDNKIFESDKEKDKSKPEPDEDDLGIIQAGFIELEDEDEFTAKNIDIPWRMSVNLNYSLDRTSIGSSGFRKSVERFDTSLNASITLTKNWRINWSARLDLINNQIVYQSFSIYRDLHCWEMSLNWQPTFDYYSFRISIKASELRDIKLTKKPTGRAFN